MNHPILWKRIARWGLPLVCGSLALSACNNAVSPNTGGTPGSSPQLSVYLKDAAGNVDSVWVQINDIMLAGDSGSVSVLSAPTGLINITSLQDSVTTLTADQQVDSGSYNQVRFVLGGAVLETTGGDVYATSGVTPPDGLQATGTLMCPSCAQSGLKVQLAQPIKVTGGSNGLLLDFDVAESFGHQAGKSGKWIMHPVIHGTTGSPGAITGGTVGGTIMGHVVLGTDSLGDTLSIPVCGSDSTSSLSAFVPTATTTTLTDSAGDSLVFSGMVTDSSTFKIDVTSYDTYALGFQAETPFDSTKLVWQASVSPSQAVVDSTNTSVGNVTYTITGATCEPIGP